MAIYLKKEELEGFNPCDLDKRLALFGRRKKLNVKQAIEAGATIRDILWVAQRLGRKDLCARFALLCAQRVAYLNPDPRVQAALDATAAWLAAPSDETRTAAKRAAAAAAAHAATYAYAATYAAAAAAYAATYAATYADAADAYARKAAKEAEQAAQIEIALEVFK